MTSKKITAIAIGMIIVASAVALASVWHDAPVVDEIPHIGAGYSYIAGHTYEFNPEHPPLAKDLAGLAIVWFAPPNPSILKQVFPSSYQTDVHGEWNFGRALLYTSGNDTIKMIHVAKAAELLFFIFSALIIFFWTRSLYGGTAALLATFLFSFSPTIIAHARLVTTDIAALFGILIGTLGIVRYLQKQSRLNFWLGVLMFGIAMLTKFSTFLLVPYAILITLIWSFANGRTFAGATKDILKVAALIVLAFVVVVGPIYQLHLINYPAAEQHADTVTILSTYGDRLLANPVIWASQIPGLRTLAQYGLGLLMVFQRNAGGNLIYFFGKNYNNGTPWYFPIVFLIKEPIPFLILVFTALFATLGMIRRVSFRPWLKKYFPQIAMLIWIILYGGLSLTAQVDIGIRYLLPIYGFLFILTAGQIVMLGRTIRTHRGERAHRTYDFVVYGLLLWYLIEMIAIYPYYLTYFNEFVGGSAHGYQYVVDSNVDWGQDLWRLADWVKANHVSKISLDYFGWADQEFYLGSAFYWMSGGEYTTTAAFLRDNPNGGYIAVSAEFYEEEIHDQIQNYAWLENYTPVTIVGHSILVWYIPPIK